jgi:3D (Asp-Asp-Asp) domain-containing protein
MNLLKVIDPSLSKEIKVALALILIVFTLNMTVPQTAYAKTSFLEDEVRQFVLKSAVPLDLLTERFIDEEFGFDNKLEEAKVLRTHTVIATAYSSTPDQTDSTPCITANGFDVCKNGEENVIAANFLRFGTKVRIPELYGDKVFTVQDRMNPKYSARIDLWKTSRNRAIDFGKRLVKIEVIE